jgi:hypothetical protein
METGVQAAPLDFPASVSPADPGIHTPGSDLSVASQIGVGFPQMRIKFLKENMACAKECQPSIGGPTADFVGSNRAWILT